MKDVLEMSILENKYPVTLIKEENLVQLSDESQISEIITKILVDNPKLSDDLKKNPKSKGFLVGLVMKETKGKANPQKVDEIINQLISKQN